MGGYFLSGEAVFSAAHTLAGVDMCERMHGHNWRVRVTVRVEEHALDAHGMGLDFRTLESLVTGAVAEFEHRYLNDLPVFAQAAPTAERITRVVYDRMVVALRPVAPAAIVTEVALWEMPEYRVIYRPA